MSEVIISDFKNYDFAYEKLNERFAKMPEEGKIEFCRSVKDGWNTPIREIFEEVMRQFYEEAALRTKTLDELNALRQAMVIFLSFKKHIENKISLFNQKINKDSTSFQGIKNI